MSTRYLPIPKNIISGNETLSAYVRNGSTVKGSDLDEIVILRTNAIAANTAYTIDLKEVGYPLKLESVWIDIPSNQNASLTILTQRDGVTIYTFSLTQSQIPYTFPFLVLKPDLKLVITPSHAVGAITIFARQIAILEEPNI